MKGVNSQGVVIVCLMLASSVVSYGATLAVLASRTSAPAKIPLQNSQPTNLSGLEGSILEVAGSRARCRRTTRSTGGSSRAASGRCDPCDWRGGQHWRRIDWQVCCPCYPWRDSSWWDDSWWDDSWWDDSWWDDSWWDDSWDGRYRRRRGNWRDRYSSSNYRRRHSSSGRGSYRGIDYSTSHRRYPSSSDAIPGAW
jgi:hypothetical protein